MTRTLEVIVESDGSSRHLVDDDSDKVLTVFGSKTQVWRNSHIESWSSLSWDARVAVRDRLTSCFCTAASLKHIDRETFVNFWWADMLPVGGPVLGPYDTHADALAAEIQWLRQNNLPHPK